MRGWWRLFPLLVFAVLAVFLWRGLSLDPQKLPSAHLNQPLPAFRLPVLGDDRQMFTPAMMQGKVALLNVWASWCSSCIDEQVFLMQLKDQGVPIFGINYKDNPQNAVKWMSDWGNPWQLTGEDNNGKAAIDLGVYGAPETFLVDRAGIVRYRHAGVLDELTWEREFLPRIKALEATS